MGRGLKEQVEDLERRLILEALRKADGVQAHAATKLKMSERVLRYKMKKYHLHVKTKLSGHDRIVEFHAPSIKTEG